ncbi:DNA-binding response regulator [Vibrio natriegens]|uniref:response regulator transcription factor n=1 Tax=Vibrio natriegens TaxID=691 RepID=UPI000803C5C8|nr:response regulator transcription factor [Vibrio natriegens]ANQ29244.1 DNA-binding response regulator [Vibrio natriegens]
MNCLIFDDHPLVCMAIKSLLETIGSMNEQYVANSRKDALNIIKEKDIQLLILDVNLSDCDGFDFHKRVLSHGYQGKVVFFSAESNPVYSQMAFRSGADGYVCKSESHELLKDAIDAISRGYTFFKFKNKVPSCTDNIILSNRENTVMKLLLQGKTNREVAHILSISDKTISTYKRRVLDKFNVKNIVELSMVSKSDTI